MTTAATRQPAELGLTADSPMWAIALELPDAHYEALRRAVNYGVTTELVELTPHGFRIEQGFLLEATPGHTGQLLVGASLE